MNVYTLNGQAIRHLTGFFQELGYSNIKSVKKNYMGEIVLEMKEGPDAHIKFLSPGVRTVSWSVEDFEHQAKERWEFWKGHKPEKYGNAEKWQDVYDEEEFEGALESMIDNHDANNGIHWGAVDYYLDENCLRHGS